MHYSSSKGQEINKPWLFVGSQAPPKPPAAASSLENN